MRGSLDYGETRGSGKWTTTTDGSRWFEIRSTAFATQGSATFSQFLDNSRSGEQFERGSYLVQGKHDEYAHAVTAAKFPAWLAFHHRTF